MSTSEKPSFPPDASFHASPSSHSSRSGGSGRPYRASASKRSASEDEAQPTLRDHVATLVGSWPLVCVIMVAALLGGAGYHLTKAPIYRSDALVQVEDKPRGVAGLEDLSDFMKMQSPAETEIEILRSRFLLGAVVDSLNLEISAGPRYAPAVGRAIARRRASADQGVASALFGQPRYAWGGERIRVERFEVPSDCRGKPFTLVANESGTYTLFGPAHEPVAKGAVGAESSAVPGAIATSIVVGELVARPGTEFVVTRSTHLATIEELQGRLTVVEEGKKTGMLRLSLEGENPEESARILDAVGDAYVRQNVERKSAEAAKSLEFISNQLPELKRKLESAETALNEYRTKTGNVDVPLEMKANLDQVGELEKSITGLRLELEDSKGLFTADHPTRNVIMDKLRRLQGQRFALEARFKKLPAAELESGRLLRDVKVAEDLYVLLLNKSQELKIVKSGEIGSVRVLDAATTPLRPVWPKLPLTLGAALLGGLFFGVAAAFARSAFNLGVEDPELFEEELGLTVYATVPRSEVQKGRGKRRRRGRSGTLLAKSHPNDLAIEALRSMRTGLQFALAEAKNNVVAICGPSPGIGKSFVAANLAQVLADSGRRVLLIDGDLRRGYLHEQIGGERAGGLSELIADGAEPEQAVREVGSNLSLITTGVTPSNPAELLASSRYEEIIQWASRTYDIVLIDTAPVLAVTDGALAARAAATTFLVLKSGQHPIREVATVVKRLAQTGVNVHGAIFNDAMRRAGYSYAKYGYHYQYNYR